MARKNTLLYRDGIHTPSSIHHNPVHDNTSPFFAMNYASSLFDLLSWWYAYTWFNSSTPPVNASLSIKLDYNNYLICPEQMESLILGYGLEGFIDGSLATPRFLDLGRSIFNPWFTNWNRLNNVVKSWIYASVSSNMNYVVSRKDTAYEQW